MFYIMILTCDLRDKQESKDNGLTYLLVLSKQKTYSLGYFLFVCFVLSCLVSSTQTQSNKKEYLRNMGMFCGHVSGTVS